MNTKIPAHDDVFALVMKIYKMINHIPESFRKSKEKILDHRITDLLRSINRVGKKPPEEMRYEPLLEDLDILKKEIVSCAENNLIPKESIEEIQPLFVNIEKQWISQGVKPGSKSGLK